MQNTFNFASVRLAQIEAEKQRKRREERKLKNKIKKFKNKIVNKIKKRTVKYTVLFLIFKFDIFLKKCYVIKNLKLERKKKWKKNK